MPITRPGLLGGPATALSVGIVGAGTAGPTAAALLGCAGHRVTLFERAPLKLPVGAGVLLQPTGMRVLQQLGVLDRLLPIVARVRRLHCLNLGDRAVLDLHYDELEPGLFGAGTHRATLLDVLLEAAAEAGADVRWDHPMVAITRAPDGRPVLRDVRGGSHGPFDLLVLCDGAQSALRQHAGVPCAVDRYPWGALWFIGRRPATFAADTLWQRVGTTRELVGFLPTGTRDDLISFFWSLKLTDVEAWRATPLESWKRQVLRLAPQSEELLHQIQDHRQVAVAVYHDVRFRCWHGDRIAILGDAAHALSPQLGQGVNLALMDAAALGAALAAFPLGEALTHFSASRRRHLRFYQRATRWATPFFQSDSTWLAAVRDVAFPLAGRVRWVRRQMVATMAGYKIGALSQLPVSERDAGR